MSPVVHKRRAATYRFRASFGTANVHFIGDPDRGYYPRVFCEELGP